MRSLLAVLILMAAISGLVVVIAYAASEAYLTFSDQDEDLNSTLMLGTLAPAGWTATAASRAGFSDQFLSPCLGVPLLKSVDVGGRGAMRFAPDAATSSNVQLLLLQTSEADARGIMSSVQRDTENGCRRGMTIGTVQQADVSPLTSNSAGEGVLVTYRQPNDSAGEHHVDAVVRQGGYVGLLTYRGSVEDGLQAAQILDLSAALAGRIENPPNLAEIEAAGLVSEPSQLERAAERLNADSTRVLTADDRISLSMGLGTLGALTALLYIAGARMGRAPAAEPPPSVPIFGSEPPAPVDPLPSRHRQPQRRWMKQSLLKPGPRASASLESDDALDAGYDGSYARAVPVLDFPQRSIDDKLQTLKEARLTESRHEPLTPLPVMPDVDWTAEISKPQRRPAPKPVDPATQPVSRKALLQKLRSQPPK
jgi:hypothetical protein